jgi:hypothetical protein
MVLESSLTQTNLYVYFNFKILIFSEQEDDTPKPDFKPPPVVPKEDNRTGANKKTYFVCNDRK